MKLKDFFLKLWLSIKPEPPVVHPAYDPVVFQLKQLWKRLFPKKRLIDYTIGEKGNSEGYNDQPFLPLLSPNPLILRIKNINDHAVEQVEILNAAKRYMFAQIEELPGIIIEYGIPGFDYSDFLMHLFSYQYKIGMTRISFQSESPDVKMDDFMFTISEQEIIGYIFTRPFIPIIMPEQFAMTIADIREIFKIDCLTSFVFQKIPAKTSIRLYLYPLLKKVNDKL